MNFHETQMGYEFYGKTVPRIAKALEQLGRGCYYQIHVRCLGEARYQITEVSPRYISDYQNELNYGYER